MEKRLSDWLTEQVEFFDKLDGRVPSAEDRMARVILEAITEELIEGREAFTDGGRVENVLRKLTGKNFDHLEHLLRNEPEINEAEIDRVLTTRALGTIGEMTRRVVNLSKLSSPRIPSDQTAAYIREAARAYFYGLFQASVIMSRAALEQSLKEVLGIQGHENFITFKELRKKASTRKILDDVTEPAVRDFFRDASTVTHHKPTDSRTALRFLDRSRGLIEQIYVAAGS